MSPRWYSFSAVNIPSRDIREIPMTNNAPSCAAAILFRIFSAVPFLFMSEKVYCFPVEMQAAFSTNPVFKRVSSFFPTPFPPFLRVSAPSRDLFYPLAVLFSSRPSRPSRGLSQTLEGCFPPAFHPLPSRRARGSRTSHLPGVRHLGFGERRELFSMRG